MDPISSEKSLAGSIELGFKGHHLIEYLRAHQAELLMRKAVVAGQDVQVTLRSDPHDEPRTQPCPD